MAALASILRRIEALENSCPEPRSDEAEIEARILERFDASQRKATAYAALSVADKIAEKKRALAETVAAWEGRDRDAFCVNTELMHTLRCRSLALDIEELEGASADHIDAARTQANEDFRYRGRRPAESISTVVERSRIVQPVAVSESELPTPIEHPFVDRLADYRGGRETFLEPGDC
jgi:hypothetical protein